MASSDRLREIQRSRVQPSTSRERHASRFDRPANMRAILYVIGAIVLAGSIVGALQFSAHSGSISYAQHEINSQIEARLPIGSGSVQIKNAQAYLGGGLFQIDALAAGETYQTSLALTGQLKFDPIRHVIMIEDSETTVAEPVKHGLEMGDGAAEYVPEDWSLIQAVVRTTTNFATGETFNAMQFKNKAKRTLWAMPVFEVPAKDRPVLRDFGVSGIAVENGAVVIDVSGRRLTPLTAFCLILLAGSAVLLFTLRSYPDLARG